MKKKTTTRTFKYDPEGRITEETVTEIEEDVPTYPNIRWFPVYPTYPTYPYTIWSSGSITTTNGTYTTFNNSINPPEKPKD